MVTNGSASVLDMSHLSLDFLTPHTNILVYMKYRTFKLTPNSPRYKGILHIDTNNMSTKQEKKSIFLRFNFYYLLNCL